MSEKLNKDLVMKYVERGQENLKSLTLEQRRHLTIECLCNLMHDDFELICEWLNPEDDKHLINLILRAMLSKNEGEDVVDSFAEIAMARSADYLSDLFYVCRRQLEAIRECESYNEVHEWRDDDARMRARDLREGW